MPLANGGVHRTLSCTQNKLLLAASATSPSVFSSRPSSAPLASASARARICGSLLQVLNWASGSFAGSRQEEVTRLQRAGASLAGAGCNDITSEGRSAPFGE